MEHVNIPLGEVHTPHNWQWADEAARAAKVVTDVALIDRVGLQISDGTLWRLAAVLPAVAWEPVAQVVPWTGVTGKPETFAPSAHGHTVADVAGLQAALDGKQPTGAYIVEGDARLADARPASDVYAWAKEAAKPDYTATEVGAAPAAHVGATGTAHGIVTTSVAGFMSAADKTKLDGVATNANNYAHPTGDGNLHVPATGTTNAGKVLTAGATAGSLSWATPLALGSSAGTAAGTAAAGTATTAARSDHVHPVQTSVSGNAVTATKLATPRTLTIGSTGKAFDGSGDLTWTLAEIGATGLQYLTEVRNITTPNATLPVHGVQASGAEPSIDLVLGAKGQAAIVAHVPNGAVSGGNKRGIYATDWQRSRFSSTQVASGSYASICGGDSNAASAAYATVGGGSFNTASGTYATVGGGMNHTASAAYATVGGGSFNTASGENSTIPGGKNATTNSIQGLLSYGFAGTGLGKHQMSFFGGRAVTADATPTRITANAEAASASNQLTLRDNSAFRVRGTVVARNTSTNDAKEWTFEALIKRGANAAVTAIVGTPTIASTFADTAAEGWAIAISADTTNGALAITGTGAASTSIRWTAVVHSIEVA